MSQQPKADENQIKDLVMQFHQAATNADLAFMDQIFANDSQVQLIGSDPAEVITGHAAVVQFWTDLFQGLRDSGYPNNGGLPTVSNGESIHVSVHGPMAWATDLPTWHFAKDTVAFRQTFVFEREQGSWKISHTHFSVGIANADLPL
jgi:ketosteroid isomerase-like protein